MADFDLVIRNAHAVTASDSMHCDIGIRDGRIAALATGLGFGARKIDAAGRLVTPGDVESHSHIEQLSSGGIYSADDFYSGTVSATFGGATTVIPFAAQPRGDFLRAVGQDNHARAEPKAIIDYAFHLILTDPTKQVLGQELPALIRDGYIFPEVYLTYERMRINDYRLLPIMALARSEGARAMIHAENDDAIRWFSEKLLTGGYRAPKHHAVSHSRLGEGEAPGGRAGGARGHAGADRARLHRRGHFKTASGLSQNDVHRN